jgi:hypothetical protein
LSANLRGRRAEMPPFHINYSIDLGSIANLVAVLVAAASIWAGFNAVKKQISLSVFSEYSKRYHEIMRRFPLKMWTIQNLKIDAFSAEERERLTESFADFFRLLAGERHLRLLKFVDDRTWRLWLNSTAQLMAQPASKEVWNDLRAGFSYDPGFQKFVDGYSK